MKKINLTLKLVIPISLGIIIYWLLGLSKNKSYRDWNDILSDSTISIAMPYNLIDFSLDTAGVKGFQYELISTVLIDKNIKLNLIPIADFNGLIEGLQNGSFDIAAAPIPNTIELKEQISLTKPILKNKLVLVQRSDSTAYADSLYINNQLQLAQKEIYVVKKSPAILRLENLSNEIADTIYIKELDRYGDEQLITLVAHGDIDYAICDERIASTMKQSYPNLDISIAIGFTQFYSWGVNKNSTELLDSLNQWIDQLIMTDKYTKIYSKYFSSKNFAKH